VAEALEEYLTALEEGRQPTRQAFLAKHPEIAGALAECLDGLELVYDVGPELSQPADGQTAAGDGGGPPLPLGDFHILREVGRGGMGVVYEAEQLSLGRRVALKVLPFAAALDARQLQRFKNEAQAAAHLHHTNIVPIHAVGCERGVHYYAMQFIEGRTLAEVIRELRRQAGLEDVSRRGAEDAEPTVSPSEAAQRSLRLCAPSASPASTAPNAKLTTHHSQLTSEQFRQVATWGVQAAEALEHAHNEGVLHRDIKPANLLIDARHHLWITDFGLAQCQGDPKLTLTGDLLGTLRYMSPEQALAKRVLMDHRTDIYSLGATLYELLTLQPAFDGPDRQEILRKIAFDDPPQLRRINKVIPKELEIIVLKAIEKHPEHRYATAQEMAEDLQRFLLDKPIQARPPTLWTRTAKWARRHKSVVVSAIVLLVMAVVGLSVSTVLIAQAKIEAEQQRDEADSHRKRAEDKAQFARQVVDEMYSKVAERWLADEPEMEELQREFLLKALTFYEEFTKEQGTDWSVRTARAAAYDRVGHLQLKLGRVNAADEAFSQALTLFRQLAEEFPTQPAARSNLASCYCSMGAARHTGLQYEEAERLYRQAILLQEKLAPNGFSGCNA
jgi:serine/threonine protein kinase